MKMRMMSQMMGVNQSGNNNGLGQMMAMSMFMGGKDNPFEGMFDFDFDTEIQDDDDENNVES
jgi:hypothetical protein